MKEFEDLTDNEKDEILKQINQLPEQAGDSLDMFVRSFNDISKTWASAIKEFDNIYSETVQIDDSPKSGSQANTNWKLKVKGFLR